ncbi:hypothetical protein OD305_003843 [Salmonella enterica]|nr:hypothetical protein [Salmonella enterica]EJX3111559.1 hypothetical protein [Salmonella enterica]EJX3603109.1 hypothetical protein [Salmonella enterica]
MNKWKILSASVILFISMSVSAYSKDKTSNNTIIKVYKSAILNLIDSTGCDIDGGVENAFTIERPGLISSESAYAINATKNGTQVYLYTNDDTDIKDGIINNKVHSITISDDFNTGVFGEISDDGRQFLCIVRAYQEALSPELDDSLLMKNNNSIYIDSLGTEDKHSFKNKNYLNVIQFSTCSHDYCHLEFKITPIK